MNKKQRWTALLIGIALAGPSCATVTGYRQMDPAGREFYSQVQYIITREESQVFLELAPSSQPRFIEEFWQRRDPTPGTERNEFREAYYRRIEEANRLFRGAKPGWLQDRGRFYVLFGPPNERRTNPMGGRPIDATTDHRELTGGLRASMGEKASEVWVYYDLISTLQKPQSLELVFVDSDATGDYVLATNLEQLLPGGLDSLLRPSIELTHEIYKEEEGRARPFLRWIILDFGWELIKQKDPVAGSNLLIRIHLPYARTVFREFGDRLLAELKLDIAIRDSSGETLWEHILTDTLSLALSTWEEKRSGAWEAGIPVPLILGKGKYTIYIRLENSSADQVVDKLLPLKM